MINVYNIPVKNEVKYLGIIVTNDRNIRETTTIENNIQNSRAILKSWLWRDISILGRILLTRMESLSRLIYPSLDISNNLIKIINQDNINFK